MKKNKIFVGASLSTPQGKLLKKGINGGSLENKNMTTTASIKDIRTDKITESLINLSEKICLKLPFINTCVFY